MFNHTLLPKVTNMSTNSPHQITTQLLGNCLLLSSKGGHPNTHGTDWHKWNGAQMAELSGMHVLFYMCMHVQRSVLCDAMCCMPLNVWLPGFWRYSGDRGKLA